MKYPTNPILEFFGFGKPKGPVTPAGNQLLAVLTYISINTDNDPDLKKDAAQLKEMGISIYMSKYAYTNLVLCAYTVFHHYKKGYSYDDLAVGSKSAKRLIEWGKKKRII